MSEILSRNLLAWGRENQQKLSNLHVCVVGADIISQKLLSALAGVGVGNITIMDNSRVYRKDKNFLIDNINKNLGKEKVYLISDVLNLINEKININPLFSKFSESFLSSLNVDIIVDTTNSIYSKECSSFYAFKKNIPFLSMYSDKTSFSLTAYYPDKFSSKNNFHNSLEKIINNCCDNRPQGISTSGMVAGIGCEEIRKLSFRYDEKDFLLDSSGSEIYNYGDKQRKNLFNRGIPIPYEGMDVIIFGSGALGNHVCLDCALHGVNSIDIIDFDRIERHNLNRQILLYNRVNEYKSKVIAERIRNINPEIDVNYSIGKVGELSGKEDLDFLKGLYNLDKENWAFRNKQPKKNFISLKRYKQLFFESNDNNISLINPDIFSKKKYDLIFGCFDNKYARLWLDRMSQRYSIPYIDGGSNPYNGQAYFYYPNISNPIEKQMNLLSFNFPDHIISCIDHPEASVVMSNMVIGGVMVLEGLNNLICDKKDIITPIRYDCRSKSKIII